MGVFSNLAPLISCSDASEVQFIFITWDGTGFIQNTVPYVMSMSKNKI